MATLCSSYCCAASESKTWNLRRQKARLWRRPDGVGVCSDCNLLWRGRSFCRGRGAAPAQSLAPRAGGRKRWHYQRRHGTLRAGGGCEESGVVDEVPLTATWREPASLATHARDLGHTYRLEASHSASM